MNKLRKCVVCGEIRPKDELIRIAKLSSGEVVPDPLGRGPGRGAYLCRNRECVNGLRKKRGLEKSFRCFIPGEVYERIEETFREG